MQRGQALLVVMLVLAVAMTVGLSVVSRSVTEVSVSTTQEESARALSVAEAGVENALGQISGNPNVTLPTSPQTVGTAGTYVLSQSPLGGGTQYIYPDKLVAGDTATILLPATLPATPPTFKVCWDDGPNDTALEVSVYYGNPVAVFRTAYRHSGTGGFTVVNQDAACSAVGGYYGTEVSGMPTSGLISARLRLFYNGSTPKPVGVIAGVSLPRQGNLITSEGQSGQTTQKVQVNEISPDVPPIFDTALFSGGALSQ